MTFWGFLFDTFFLCLSFSFPNSTMSGRFCCTISSSFLMCLLSGYEKSILNCCDKWDKKISWEKLWLLMDSIYIQFADVYGWDYARVILLAECEAISCFKRKLVRAFLAYFMGGWADKVIGCDDNVSRC